MSLGVAMNVLMLRLGIMPAVGNSFSKSAGAEAGMVLN